MSLAGDLAVLWMTNSRSGIRTTADRPGGRSPGERRRRGWSTPFVGRSGRLLDQALTAVGIDRARCLVANVFRRQPPGNKVAHFFASRARAGGKGWRSTPAAGARSARQTRLLALYAGELDHLAEALATFKPDSVVALGRTPTWALTGRNGILELREADCPAGCAPGRR